MLFKIDDETMCVMYMVDDEASLTLWSRMLMQQFDDIQVIKCINIHCDVGTYGISNFDTKMLHEIIECHQSGQSVHHSIIYNPRLNHHWSEMCNILFRCLRDTNMIRAIEIKRSTGVSLEPIASSICAGLVLNTSVRSITFHDHSDQQTGANVARMVSINTTLEKLAFVDSPVFNLSHVCRAMAHNTSVKSMVLSRARVVINGYYCLDCTVDDMSHMLRHNQFMETFVLQHHHLYAYKMHDLISALVCHASMTVIEMDNFDHTTNYLEALLTNQRLTMLRVSSFRVDKNWVECAKINTTLTHVQYCTNHDVCTILQAADMLRQHTSLQMIKVVCTADGMDNAVNMFMHGCRMWHENDNVKDCSVYVLQPVKEHCVGFDVL